MTEIPIVVSDDVVTVGGYTDKVELQLSVGATGERGSRIFTGSVNPNTLPSNDPIWGGYTDFKRGDIYLLRDTDLLEVWEYLWSGGEYVWVQTVDNIAGGGGSVTLDPDLDAIAALTGTGILKRTAPNTWALDTTSYLTANQTITLSGDASGSGTTSIVVTVADDSHSHTGSTISGLDAGDTTTGTFDIARIPTGTSGTTVALGNHTHSYQPVDGDLTAIAAVSGTGYLRRTGVDTWTLDTPATATWGGITGTLSSQTDLQSALDGKQSADADLTAIAALAGTSGLLKKTAANTWTLDTATYLTANQTITLSGDASGSGTTAITVTVADDSHAHTSSTISALDAGDTTTGTFDIARIPTGTTGTTVALGNHTHSYQPLDADLTAIAALAGTSGLLKKTAADTWTLDTNTYITGNQTITLSGVVTGSGTTAITTAFAASPTFTGTVTIPTLDLTTSATATAATSYFVETGSDGVVRPKTLANVKSEIVTTAAVNSAAATTVGTITSGVWNGTAIGATYIDSAIARLASPTFTGTPAAPTAAVDTNTTQIATTEYVVGQGYLKSATASSTYQPLNGDLTSIAGLAGTTGLLRKTAASTWSLDTASYLTANQTITLSGDATGSGTTAITVTVVDDSHSHTGTTISALDASDTTTGTFDIARIPTGTTGTTVSLGNHTHSYLSSSTSSTQAGYFGDIYLYDDSTPSHYLQVTNSANLTAARLLNINVNDADRTISLSGNLTVPSAATVSGTNTGDQTITLTGDVTGSGTGSFATTLAASGVSAGTYNNVATEVRPFTVDAKGRITSIGTAVTIAPAWGSISGKPTTLSGYGITDALSNSTSSTQSGYFGDIYLYDDSTPSHYLQITNSANLTASRLLSINVNDAARTVSLSGDLTVSSTATVSGTNTGDQTITLTGNVTGSGTGSFATTIANDAVTYAKMQNVSAQYRVLGRISASAGDAEELTGENLVTVLGQATSKTGSGSIVFHTAPTFSGTVTATTFSGSGASLTSIPQSAVTNLTTDLSGKQPLDADLTAIAGLAGTSGLLKKTAADTWTLDTSTYLTSNQTITLSGDATGSGTTAITVAVVDDSHSHTGATISGLDAGDTTTGTFDIARIPTGTTGSTVALGNHTHSYLPLSGGTLTGVVWQSAGGIGQYGSGRSIEQRDTLGSGYGWTLSSTSTDWFILGVYDTLGDQPGTLIFNSTSNRWQFTGNIRSADNIMINGSSKLLIGTETGGFKGEIRSQSNYPIVFMPYDQTGTALSSAEFFYKTDSSRWQTESNFRVDGTLWIGGASTLDGNTVITGSAASDHAVKIRNNASYNSALFVQRPVGANSAQVLFGDTADKNEATIGLNSSGLGITLKLDGTTGTSGISFYSGNTPGASVGTTDIGIRAKLIELQATTVQFNGLADFNGGVSLVGSSTDNAIVRFDSTAGNVQNSGVTVSDINDVTVPGNVYVNGTASTDPILRVDAATGRTPYLTLRSQGPQDVYMILSRENVTRFAIRSTQDEFSIRSASDAGDIWASAPYGNVFQIHRPTGKITLGPHTTGGYTAGLEFGTSGPRIMTGTTSPEGSVTAPVGSEVINTSDGSKYDKISGTGNTGWSLRVNGAGYVEDTQVMMMMGVL